MKKLCSKFWAKLVAALLLPVFLLITVISLIGIAVFYSEDVYVDGGKRLRDDVCESFLYRNEAYVNDYLNITECGGQAYEAESRPIYEDLLSAESTGFRCTVTAENGSVIYQSAGGGTVRYQRTRDMEIMWCREETSTYYFQNEDDFNQYMERLSLSYDIISTDFTGNENLSGYATVTYGKWVRRTCTITSSIVETSDTDTAISLTLQWIDRLLPLRNWLFVFFAVGLLLTVLLIVFLCCSAGHRAGMEGIRQSWMDRIPLELLLGIFILADVFLAWLVDYFIFDGERLLWQMKVVFGAVAYVLAYLTALCAVSSFVRRVKAGHWWKNTVVYFVLLLLWKVAKKLGRLCCAAWKNFPLYWKAGLTWLILSLIEIPFFSNYAPMWILEKLIFTPLLIWAVIGLRRLQKGARELSSGDLGYTVNVDYMLPTLKEHGERLNSIRDGMQSAVERQMRSERMKAELITNVSHDIKTPLTSIINYVDLLKKEGLDSEHAAQYLEVLDRQSARLKKLTEDLVEASKASTGNITVNAEPTDLSLLLSQAAGEYEERLRSRSLESVLTVPKNAPPVLADGRLMWRVFDNLLGNICKYAQPQTRVYLSFRADEEAVSVTLKNVSAEPLNLPPEELMERFTRGDASRNTEGSGLGLSIAKSLTELQGGSFLLDIDGDLFKATVTFPIAK